MVAILGIFVVKEQKMTRLPKSNVLPVEVIKQCQVNLLITDEVSGLPKSTLGTCKDKNGLFSSPHLTKQPTENASTYETSGHSHLVLCQSHQTQYGKFY